MALTLTGSQGLFTRLGRIGGAQNAIISMLGTTDLSGGTLFDSVGNAIDEIRDEYTTSRSDLINGLYQIRDDYRNVHSSYLTGLQTLASNTVIQQVNDENNLTALTITAGITELIMQLVGAGGVTNPDNDVDANTVSATATASALNEGTTVGGVSVVNKYGLNLQYIYAEDVVVTCTADSYTGGATAYRETFRAVGEVAVSSKFAWNWPQGSGCAVSITSTDSAQDAGTSIGANRLTNSDWSEFTIANDPDNWTILVGTAGTHVFDEGSVVLRTGGAALKITGDASNLTSLAQIFGSDTVANLEPNKVYALNFWGRKTAGVVAGVLAVRLIDGTNATITNDLATSQTTSYTLSGWTTSYVAKTQFFQTPNVLPASGVKLNLALTTAITNAESIYIAELSLCEAQPLYTGGPYVAVFGGATKPAVGDFITVAVANDYAGLFQQMFWKNFDMPTLGLQLPYDTAAGETLVDTLVTPI